MRNTGAHGIPDRKRGQLDGSLSSKLLKGPSTTQARRENNPAMKATKARSGFFKGTKVNLPGEAQIRIPIPNQKNPSIFPVCLVIIDFYFLTL